MEKKLLWGGVILVALGLILPWASVSISAGQFGHSATAAGYEYVQSLIALALSVVGILVSLKLSQTGKAAVLTFSGVVIIVVAATAFGDLSGPVQTLGVPDVQLPADWPRDMPRPSRKPSMSVSASPHIGLFVTMLGGGVIAAAGIIGLVAVRQKG